MLVKSLVAQKVAAALAAVAIGTGGVAAASIVVDTEPDPVVTEEAVDVEAGESELVEEQEVVEGSEDVEELVEGSEEVDELAVADSDVEESAEADEVLPPADDEGVPYGADCDAGNHGDYVSSVARDPRVAEADGNRGSIVSQAAKTDCGKKDKDKDEDERDEEDELEDDEEFEVEDELDEDDDDESDDDDDDDDDKRSSKADKANERGNGQNNGKGPKNK